MSQPPESPEVKAFFNRFSKSDKKQLMILGDTQWIQMTENEFMEQVDPELFQPAELEYLRELAQKNKLYNKKGWYRDDDGEVIHFDQLVCYDEGLVPDFFTEDE